VVELKEWLFQARLFSLVPQDDNLDSELASHYSLHTTVSQMAAEIRKDCDFGRENLLPGRLLGEEI